MTADVRTQPPRDDRDWFIVGRWQEYEGEGRANLLRIAGVGAFYCVELANYYTGVVDRPFHQAVTALAFAWAMVALGVLFCLGQHIFPASLKFVSTAADIVLLTAILTVADGPKSLRIVAYFLLIFAICCLLWIFRRSLLPDAERWLQQLQAIPGFPSESAR